MSAFPEADNCDFGDECPLVATATVKVNGVVATQAEVSTPLMPDPLCGFEFYYDAADDFVSDPVEVSDLCIWTLPEDDGVLKTGVWEITLDPMPPRNPKRPINVSVTVRYGVPGNWCPLAIGLPSGISEPWTVGDDLPTGKTYLPGDEDILGLGLAEGMCINGGARRRLLRSRQPEILLPRRQRDCHREVDRGDPGVPGSHANPLEPVAIEAKLSQRFESSSKGASVGRSLRCGNYRAPWLSRSPLTDGQTARDRPSTKKTLKKTTQTDP